MNSCVISVWTDNARLNTQNNIYHIDYTSHQVTVFHILIYCFWSWHLVFLNIFFLRIVSATYALGIPAVVEVTEFLMREQLWFLQLPVVAKYCPSRFAARNAKKRLWKHWILGGGFNFFCYFHLYFGERWTHFDELIFFKGVGEKPPTGWFFIDCPWANLWIFRGFSDVSVFFAAPLLYVEISLKFADSFDKFVDHLRSRIPHADLLISVDCQFCWLLLGRATLEMNFSVS